MVGVAAIAAGLSGQSRVTGGRRPAGGSADRGATEVAEVGGDRALKEDSTAGSSLWRAPVAALGGDPLLEAGLGGRSARAWGRAREAHGSLEGSRAEAAGVMSDGDANAAVACVQRRCWSGHAALL